MDEVKPYQNHIVNNDGNLHIVDLEFHTESLQIETDYGRSIEPRRILINISKLRFLDDLGESSKVVFCTIYKTEKSTFKQFMSLDKTDFGFEDNLKLENVNLKTNNFFYLQQIHIHDKRVEESIKLFINRQLTGIRDTQEHVKHIFNKGKDCGMFKYLQRCMFLTFKQPISEENSHEWCTVLLDSIKMNKTQLLHTYPNNSFNLNVVGNVVDYIEEQTFDGDYEISIDQVFKTLDYRT